MTAAVNGIAVLLAISLPMACAATAPAPSAANRAAGPRNEPIEAAITVDDLQIRKPGTPSPEYPPPPAELLELVCR